MNKFQTIVIYLFSTFYLKSKYTKVDTEFI